MGFGFLTFLFFAFAKPFVMVMTQPPFHGAYSVVGWSAASQFFIGLFSVLLPAAYLAKEAKYITIIQGIAAVFSIAINIILIHFWGKDGAGIGLAVGLLSLPMILYWWNLKRGERYIQVQYEWKRLTLLFTLFGIISLIFLIPRNFSLIQELLFSFSASIFVTLLTLALLTEKEKSVLRDLRQRFLLTL
jgi:O-antigen/teichoic acid export membrane protein